LAPPDPLHARDDTTLARLAAVGDRAALDVLLGRHVDRVHAICRRILGDREDALDATQEALIAVARSIARFDERSAFTTWLYRVATNAALDELRRRGRRPTPVETLAETTAAPHAGPEAAGDRIDIDAALARVPEEFRVAVVLRDLCDLDYAQIADLLDLPPGTVRSRIARGRAALARELGPATVADAGSLPAGSGGPGPGNQLDPPQRPTERQP
jgi:RNA polymerase sigma-70 factor, ECF subfamily